MLTYLWPKLSHWFHTSGWKMSTNFWVQKPPWQNYFPNLPVEYELLQNDQTFLLANYKIYLMFTSYHQPDNFSWWNVLKISLGWAVPSSARAVHKLNLLQIRTSITKIRSHVYFGKIVQICFMHSGNLQQNGDRWAYTLQLHERFDTKKKWKCN